MNRIMMVRGTVWLACAGWAGMGFSAAFAACSPQVPAPTKYVGSDSKCDYALIQEAIDAIAVNNTCAPNIVVSAEHAWTGQHLNIANRSLNLIGSAGACGVGNATATAPGTDAAPTSPQVTLSGQGQASAPVISITGASQVSLQLLEVTGGLVNSLEGGGINFTGSGSLSLQGVTVDDNVAVNGGGILFNGISGASTLTLHANTLVLNNTATNSGGGIVVKGSSRLFMLEAASTIAFNKALGSNSRSTGIGGGLEVLGPARADVASSGAFFTGAISNNNAPFGGGVAVLGSATGGSTLRLFSTDASQPVLLSQNSSTNYGGAIYLRPYNSSGDTGTGATLCAYDFRIDSNTAAFGAAILGDADDNLYGTSIYLNPPGQCGPEPRASLGGVSCAAGTPCNEISDNTASDANGAIIDLSQYVTAQLAHLAMHDNVATSLIDADLSFGEAANFLQTCLLTDNHLRSQLIRSDAGYFGAPLDVRNCTMANNIIDNGYSIAAVGGLTLSDSIIDQPGTALVDHNNGDCDETCTFAVKDVMANDISTAPVSNSVIAIDPDAPLFVDPARRNYHLSAYRQGNTLYATRAIDFAASLDGDSPSDMDGNPYTSDVVPVPDFFGVRDLGAYEAQPITDRIFGDAMGDALTIVR